MFKQIVSKLSLSPSAISELAFYSRRLSRERTTRTFSAVGAVLIIGLQFATVLAPPTPSNAASPNDIIYGGVVSKADLLNRYDSDPKLRDLYKHFGITRQDIVNTAVATINSQDRSLNSTGRLQHQATDQKLTAGSTTYWARPLYAWDTGWNMQSGSSYKVLAGQRFLDHGYFSIILQSGNIVFRSVPLQPKPTQSPTPTPTPTPKPTATPRSKVKPKPTPTPALAPAPVPAPPAEYRKSKSAMNLSQSINATTAPARAGDLIRYQLTTENVSGGPESYTLVEHIGDILEYATLADNGGATLQDGALTWPASIIKPGEALVRTFTIKVNNPIPATPAGLSDKFSYDLRLDNVYGNGVTISLDPPVAKQVEDVTASLPPTSPGVSTVIVLIVSALAIFFYYRNRQMSSEVRILRHDYHGGLQ